MSEGPDAVKFADPVPVTELERFAWLSVIDTIVVPAGTLIPPVVEPRTMPGIKFDVGVIAVITLLPSRVVAEKLVVTTAASNQSTSFKLFASDGTGEYLSNGSATVMVSAQGV